MNRIISFAVLLLCLIEARAFDLNDSGMKPNQWVTSTGQLITNNYNGLNQAQFFAKDQDPKYGRDAAQGRGALLKIGGGDSGFDFTRICGNGDEEGSGTCPNGLTANDIGAGSAQWACTRDNVTGRTWELKTGDGGLQDVDWAYTWYSTDAGSNGGNAGAQTPSIDPESCGSELANCNTEEYAAALNALNGGTGLCGYTDWRLPFPDESVSIIDYGATPNGNESGPEPHIDLAYFPYVKSVLALGHYYWTATSSAEDPTTAWTSPFHLRFTPKVPKSGSQPVMLVRGQYPSHALSLADSPSTAQDADCVNENTAIPAFTPTSDFTLNADGTATHHKTGLIWDRCLLDISGSPDCTPGNGYGDTWANTLNRIALLNASANGYKGHNDWRMPNIKELMSIVEYRCWGPAFNTTVFPNIGLRSGDDLEGPSLWTTALHVTDSGGGAPRAVHISDGFRDGQTATTIAVYLTVLVRGGRPLDRFDDQFPSWLLRVTKAGEGNGTVIDSEGNCPGIEENNGDCLVAPGNNVNLQAMAGPGSVFVGWSQASGSVSTDCNGIVADCPVSTIAASGSVTATFQEAPIFADGFEQSL